MMPQEGAASVQRPARPAGRYQLAVILGATRALRSGQRLGNSARLSKLIAQAHDAGARSLLDQIAGPLWVAARADALVLGPAEHPAVSTGSPSGSPSNNSGVI
jgi:hypothetical protein